MVVVLLLLLLLLLLALPMLLLLLLEGVLLLVLLDLLLPGDLPSGVGGGAELIYCASSPVLFLFLPEREREEKNKILFFKIWW